MATGGLTPIRGNDAYIAWAKQAAWGTPLAPTNFWRWLDGSEWNPENQVTSEREGDTSPFISLSWKDHQMGMIKVVEYARPITMGCAVQALLGTGSDAFVAPTKNTTLAASVVAGATTFQSTGDLGNTSTLAIAVEGGYSSVTGEVVTVNLVSRTGAGPWTYTLNGASTFKLAHTNGGTIVSQVSHVLTRQNGAYDPYTLEWAYGHSGGTPAQAWRLQDAVCTELKISGQTNKPLKLEHTWYGALNKLQAALSTPIFEGVGTMGTPTQPFRYDQAGTSWTVDGAQTGNAVTISKFDITLKNSTDVHEFITEGLTPAFFQPSNFDISANLDAVFTSWAQYNNTYFGAAALAAGASDAPLVGLGAFLATFTLDPISSLTLSLPNVSYTGAKLAPKLDAKAIHQPLTLVGQRGQGVTNPLAITLTNAQPSQY